jgi:hypothetical protein
LSRLTSSLHERERPQHKSLSHVTATSTWRSNSTELNLYQSGFISVVGYHLHNSLWTLLETSHHCSPTINLESVKF